MSNRAIDQILLDAIVRQGGPRLKPEQVEFSRASAVEIEGQPRRFNVKVLPPLNEVIKDFTIVMQPNQLNKQLPGGALLAYPREWTPESIVSALSTELNVKLYDDQFGLVENTDGYSTNLRLVANENTMLFSGELVLSIPRDPYKVLIGTNGGLNQIVNSQQFAEAHHAQRLGHFQASLPVKWPGKLDRALFASRRESASPALALLETYGGPINVPYKEYQIEVDGSTVDLNTHYLCGGYQLTQETADDTVTMRLWNLDANGDRLLSWEETLKDTKGWVAIPITAESSVLEVAHTTLSGKTSVGLACTLLPYRMVFLTQAVEEYAPEIDGPSRVKFSGLQRLESDLMELGSSGHFIGARIHVASLPTTGITKIISVEGQDDAFLTLEYDASDRTFQVRYGEIVQKVTVDWNSFVGQHITVAANIGQQAINVFAEDSVAQGQLIPPINPVGPSSGRIRVGGSSDQSISLIDFFHFKGMVTAQAAKWFVNNHKSE